MAPHSLRSYYNSEEVKKPATPSKFEEDYGLECYREPIGKEAFFRSMGLRMKRVRYDKFFEEEEICPKRRKIDIPVGICLRECSVVIQGIMCKICGRNFKCSTDLVIHMKSRHIIVEDSFGNDIYCDLSSETDTDASRVHDSSSPTLEDTKIRQKKGRKRLSRMRLVFKLGTEVMGDLFIKRKHLKSGVIGKSRQTHESVDSEAENYEHDSQNTSLHISYDKCVTTNVQTGAVAQTEVTDPVLINQTVCKSISPNKSAYTNCRVGPVEHPTIEGSIRPATMRAADNVLKSIRKLSNTSGSSAVSANNESLPKQNIHKVHPYSITLASACMITRVDNSVVPNESNRASTNLTSETNVSNATKNVLSAPNKLGVPTCNNSLPKQSIHRTLPRPVVTVTPSLTHVQTSPATNSTNQVNHNNLSITCVCNTTEDALSTSDHFAISSRNTSSLNPDVNRGLPSSTTVSPTHTTTCVKNSTITSNAKHVSPNKFAREILQNGSAEIRPNVFVRPVLASREQRTTFAGQPSLRENSTELLKNYPANEVCLPATIENFSLATGCDTMLPETTKQGNYEDDIQEIVRISRGKKIPDTTEINHESPNRTEREILQVMDAITDMIRMEAQGLHLLAEKRNTDKMKVTRVSSKDDKKNLKQENVHQDLFGNVKMPNMQRPERVESYSFQSETTKENVPAAPYKNPSEAFQHYSFNYSSASPEIRSGNKMTPHHSQYSHPQREPESKGNKTVILIDLVDD